METEEKLFQSGNMDKNIRYGWKIIDKPGELMWIPKTDLEVDHIYQRGSGNNMVTEISKSWSWTACGAIIVNKRVEGSFYVIDGQHRVLAALKKSDINKLPCIVFKLSSIQEEAMLFHYTNTHRRNIQSIDDFKALLVANDETALKVQSILTKYGITASSNTKSPMNLRSVASCMNFVCIDQYRFENVIELLSQLCKDYPVKEQLLGGFFYMSRNLTVDITDYKLRQRIISTGVPKLMRGISEAIAYGNGRGGQKVWAIGLRNAINTGLHNKYRFKEEMVE